MSRLRRPALGIALVVQCLALPVHGLALPMRDQLEIGLAFAVARARTLWRS